MLPSILTFNFDQIFGLLFGLKGVIFMVRVRFKDVVSTHIDKNFYFLEIPSALAYFGVFSPG